MNWRDMPSLSGLRAFAAFAQSGSVVAAGEALNVSHAAISQQLRALEQHMGVVLLDRSGRALQLTSEGTHLARALDLGFTAIAAAVGDLRQADADRPIHVTTTPTFASAWLMPRLAAFREVHPKLDMMIDPTPFLIAPSPGGIDVALRYGDGDWPGLDSAPLLTSPMVVIAAPALLSGAAISSPADLADCPWLEELGTTESTNWLRSKGVDSGITARRTQLPGNLLLDAARDGQGVAVTVRHFVEPDLAAGRLRVLFTEDTGAGYHIVTRPGVLRAPVQAFVRWLRRQAPQP
ncbi:MAG: LysR family transcriptional regulator [Sedimentitalea sp.]